MCVSALAGMLVGILKRERAWIGGSPSPLPELRQVMSSNLALFLGAGYYWVIWVI